MTPITRSSEYALRAMTYMARSGAGEFHLVRDLARSLGIPAPFLGKCLQPLVARGLLESQRGRKGGFRLVSEPSEITMFQIIDAEERLDEPRRCFLGQAECSDERACPMHEYWKRAHGELHAKMLGTSLAEIVAFCEAAPDSGYPAPAPA